MSGNGKHRTSNERPASLHAARESITYYNPIDEREADRAPLSGALIRRIFTYTRPYAARRNWLFVLTIVRGLQLPALAWMIGRTLNGPIAGQDLRGIFLHAGIYLALVIAMRAATEGSTAATSRWVMTNRASG